MPIRPCSKTKTNKKPECNIQIESKEFWVEVVIIVVHIINLSLIKHKGLQVANELQSKKVLHYNYLQLFGWEAFVHKPRSSKSTNCIFVQYGLIFQIKLLHVRSNNLNSDLKQQYNHLWRDDALVTNQRSAKAFLLHILIN